jgi:hypothetical protein
MTRLGPRLAIHELDVDRNQALFEGRRALNNFAGNVHHERSAVEHEFVLAAQHVHVHDGQMHITHACPNDVFATSLIV